MTFSPSVPAPFELLELPNGCFCVARIASLTETITGYDPVGFYASRDEAELAILRADPAPRAALAPFAAALGRG